MVGSDCSVWIAFAICCMRSDFSSPANAGARTLPEAQPLGNCLDHFPAVKRANVSFTLLASFMPALPTPNQPPTNISLLRTAYAAFNARNIDAALATMSPDITWPKAFKGGFVHGHQAVRAYWTEQWSEINPHVVPTLFYPQDAGKVLVDVHQVVRDLSGATLADEHVGHLFTIKSGLIHAMEVCAAPNSGSTA